MKLLTNFLILCLLVSCTRQIHGLHKVKSNRDRQTAKVILKKTNPVPEKAIVEKQVIVASLDTTSEHNFVQAGAQSGIVFIPKNPLMIDSFAHRVFPTDSLEVSAKTIATPTKNKLKGWGAIIFGFLSILTGLCALLLTITVDTNWGLSFGERVSLILLLVLLTGIFGSISTHGRGKGKGLGITGLTLMSIVLVLLIIFGLYLLITPIVLILQ
jgi:hypothetical protein